MNRYEDTQTADGVEKESSEEAELKKEGSLSPEKSEPTEEKSFEKVDEAIESLKKRVEDFKQKNGELSSKLDKLPVKANATFDELVDSIVQAEKLSRELSSGDTGKLIEKYCGDLRTEAGDHYKNLSEAQGEYHSRDALQEFDKLSKQLLRSADIAQEQGERLVGGIQEKRAFSLKRIGQLSTELRTEIQNLSETLGPEGEQIAKDSEEKSKLLESEKGFFNKKKKDAEIAELNAQTSQQLEELKIKRIEQANKLRENLRKAKDKLVEAGIEGVGL